MAPGRVRNCFTGAVLDSKNHKLMRARCMQLHDCAEVVGQADFQRRSGSFVKSLKIKLSSQV